MESEKPKPAAGTPPDHLSIDPKISYYNEAILNRGIGIRFNRRRCCVPEGRIRVMAGNTVNHNGKPDDHQAEGNGRTLFPQLGFERK